ncbi:protein pafB [Mycobacteroides abscessus subsp. abscessus]|nr:protein pafB [Mycobacteroides abscessus subsp. abscessus]
MGVVVESRRLGERDGDIVEIDVASPDRLVRSIASHGADAVALEPAQVRDEVVARLQEHTADEPLARRGSNGVTA